MRLLPDLEDAPGLRHEERVALAFPQRSLSYAQLRLAAADLARRVAGRRRVAVLAEARIETCVAVTGALMAGVPAIPLNPKSGPAELAHVASDADPDGVMLAPGSHLPAALAGREELAIDLDRAPVNVAGAPAPGPSLPADAPALVVYTSGTTGPPKGSIMPRRAIATNLDALAEVWRWTGEDVVVHGLPLFHGHGLVLGSLGPRRRGGTARPLGRFSPDALGRALAHHEPRSTVVFGVPTMYRRVAEAAEADPELARALSGARLLVSGSAALPSAEHTRLRELTGRDVLERYGMTETLMNTAVAADARAAPGTVGPPVPGVELRLLDDAGAEIEVADDSTIGEVHIRGPNLFLGYLNRPDATARALRDGWFATGDMATRTAEGNIRIVGRRATDLIKSGGYKIGAGEIEACLREHPSVLDAAVTSEPDPDLGERIVAWVVLRDGAEREPSALVDHVAAALAPHKRPRAVRFLDELPRNELGKVQKQRLGSALAG